MKPAQFGSKSSQQACKATRFLIKARSLALGNKASQSTNQIKQTSFQSENAAYNNLQALARKLHKSKSQIKQASCQSKKAAYKNKLALASKVSKFSTQIKQNAFME